MGPSNSQIENVFQLFSVAFGANFSISFNDSIKIKTAWHLWVENEIG